MEACRWNQRDEAVEQFELGGLNVAPDQLIRIQIGRMAGQKVQGQPATGRNE